MISKRCITSLIFILKWLSKTTLIGININENKRFIITDTLNVTANSQSQISSRHIKTERNKQKKQRCVSLDFA